MKKWIAFLLAAIMLLPLVACGDAQIREPQTDMRKETKSSRDQEIVENILLSPEDYKNPTILGSMFDGKAYSEYTIIAYYELLGKAGYLTYEYRGDDEEYYYDFTASFWKEASKYYDELEEGETAPSENLHEAEQYYEKVCSYYMENHWGEPTDRGADYTLWEVSEYNSFRIGIDTEHAAVTIEYQHDTD